MGAAFPEAVWLDKTYRLPCLDASGVRHEVPVRPFDPEITTRRIDQKPNAALRAWFAAEFEREGLKRNGRVGSADCWTIEGVAFLNHLRELAARGLTIYSRPEQLG
jgi:aminoglycoside 3-N-acetyltransferase